MNIQVQAKFISKKMNFQKHANGHERPSIIIFHKFPLSSKGLTVGCHLRPKPNFNTVLMFKNSACLSIFIKKHLFLGCLANWSRFWTGVMCQIIHFNTVVEVQYDPCRVFLSVCYRQMVATLQRQILKRKVPKQPRKARFSDFEIKTTCKISFHMHF